MPNGPGQVRLDLSLALFMEVVVIIDEGRLLIQPAL